MNVGVASFHTQPAIYPVEGLGAVLDRRGIWLLQ